MRQAKKNRNVIRLGVIVLLWLTLLLIPVSYFADELTSDHVDVHDPLESVNLIRPTDPDVSGHEEVLPENVSPDWWSQVQKSISESEYEINWQEDRKCYSSPNRVQNLRFDYNDNGFVVSPRTDNSWTVRMTLAAFGKEELNPFIPGEFTADKNKAISESDQVTVTYENTKEGMRQNFVVHEKPLGEGFLQLKIDVDSRLTFAVQAGGRGIGFSDMAGRLCHQYVGLRVTDGNGKELSAAMQMDGEDISILVNDDGAAYPILVDPLSTSANWAAESNQANAWFGTSVSSAGDVNGDGYSDVMVGAPQYDNGQFNEGRAFVYYGSAGGLAISSNWTSESDQDGAQFGISVASAGDVNGDGYSDVIIGANLYDNVESNEGRSFVYHGGTTGLSLTSNWTAESDQANALFGTSVGSAGDVNGDGYSDVIVGADNFSNGQTGEGKAFVFHGSASGLSLSSNWTAEGNQTIGAQGIFPHFGYSVASAGDVNGDGYSDVIVGAYAYDNGQFDEGRAFVYHGGASGLSVSSNWTAESNAAFGYLGWSVASAGDVNGDGYSDIISGGYTYSNGQSLEGGAWLYHGSATGLSLTANWTAESNQVNGYFGWSVASAGDVNGDGYADVIVGAPPYDNGQTDEGRVFVYHGSATGLSLASNWTAEIDLGTSLFGTSVASAGDVNGDGFSDVIVGAYFYSNGQSFEGGAFVYQGAAGGLSLTSNWSRESDQGIAQFGTSVSSAGDVNGDGYSDVIVGAKYYNTGQPGEGRAFVYHGSAIGLSLSAAWTADGNQFTANFGSSVASAGDVNGDGYSDVIVGAVGSGSGGTAYVYHGSATGLSLTHNWSAGGAQTGEAFGHSVASAGDVNGDGYSDVIIGAYAYNSGLNEQGRAFVYHGGVTGLSLVSNWNVECAQNLAHFGWSVSSAGDVNGDGYSDIIVGARNYDSGETNEGRAFVYHGSATGLSPISSWTAESNQADAYFGFSVATAGDVNGDGYSDVIVGAIRYDNSQSDEGHAFVFHGSATGLALNSNWAAESDQVSADFGFSVASAGDVNGDGYSDVIIGATFYDNGLADEGRAFVYHGSAGGLSLTSNWAAESDQLLAYFGNSVACAGDVNGDGYSDVIVGAHFYDNGEAQEGRAFVYQGNVNGVIVVPRLFRSDLSTPVTMLGRTHSTSSAAGRLLAKSFGGRVDVKAVFETKPLGVGFDNIGFAETGWTDSGIAGATIAQSLSGFASSERYKLRMRIKYSPIFSIQPYGRWIYLQGNGGLGETDFLVSNVANNEPASQSSNITFPNPAEIESLAVQWASGDGTSRIVVARAVSAVTVNPVDGKTYSGGSFGVGSELATGQFVVYNGSGNSANLTGLSGGTSYHLRIFEYAGTTNLENYNAASAPGNPNSSITLALEPTVQAGNVEFSTVTVASMALSWDNGNGNERLVAGRAGGALSSEPTDRTQYSGNPDFNSASELGTGDKILYRGSGNSVTITNLVANTLYHFRVFELNGSGANSNYLPVLGTGNPANRSTFDAEPSDQPTSLSFSSINENSLTVTFSAATGLPDGYLALVKAGSSPTEAPVDGTAYAAGNAIGTSTVAYVGSANTFALNGLTSNTIYHVDLFAYNGAADTYNYLIPSALEGSQITTTVAPTLNIPSSFGQDSFQLSWPAVAGASDYALDVSLDNFSTMLPLYSNKLLGNVTSTSVTGLLNGTTYQARLRGINAGGVSVNSNEQTALTIPATPVLTNSFGLSPGSISINWNSVTGAAVFTLDLSTDNFLNFVSGYNSLSVAGPTSYTATGLNPSSTYQARLRAQNTSGISPNSNVINGITLAPDLITQPSALAFSNVTTTSFSAAFAGASGSPSGYLALFKTGAAPTDVPADATTYAAGNTIGTSVVAFVGSSINFNMASLTPGAVYHFAVFAFSGSTQTTNYLTASPLQGSQTTLSLEPTAQTTNLSVSNITTTTLDATIAPAAGTPDGYLVVRKAGSSPTGLPVDGAAYGGGDGTVVYTGVATAFPQSALNSNSFYFYKVFSFNGSGSSINYLTNNPYATSALTLPDAPVAKASSNSSTTFFDANWDPSTGSAAMTYELDLSRDNFATIDQNLLSISGTTVRAGSLLPSTDYQYRVRAINSTGPSANSNFITARTSDVATGTLLKINTAPSTGTLPAGSSQTTITVNVSGGVGAKTVLLNSRAIVGTSFSTIVATDKGGDNFEVTVTESMLDELGLEFYFEATDQAGTNVKQSSNSYLYRAIAAGTNAPAIPFAPGFSGKGSTYQMFSVPYRLADENIANLFDPFLNGQDKTQWRLYHYQNGANAEYPDVVKKIELGKGYWFNTIISDVQIRLGQANVEHANQTTSFTMSLDQGWNQVGNPYPFDISWTAVLGSNDKVGELNFYSNGNYQTNNVFGDWTGAFVFADEATTLPVPVSAKTGPARMHQQELLSTLDDEAWMLPIEIRINDLSRQSGIGMHPMAKMSKDKYDRITLPRFIDYVELNTNHNEFFSPRFSTDVVPSAADHSWLFEIETNQKNAKAELTWDVQALQGVQSSLVIIDLLDKTWVDMKTAGAYSFTQKEGTQFKIIYNRKGEIHSGLTLLGDAYPNPFSNEVTIPLLLDKDEMTLQIDIYNLLGQRVKTLSQSFMKAGLGYIVWDGRDGLGGEVSTGMLLYRVSNINGGASQVKRMIKQ